MKSWQADQLRLVATSVDTDSTFDAVHAEVSRLGFRYCSFGMKAPVPLVAPRVLWCSNYPMEWQKRYETQGYLRCDPTVAHAIVSDDAVLWSEALFASCPELRRDARSFGLVFGWAQPRRDACGMVSLLTCARTEPEIGLEEFKAKQERVQWLSYLCHEGMGKHWAASLRGEPESSLSDRELEVLRWSCDGKTSTDIAQIISLSEATVNFHIRNACTKLGTSNRTAAAVRAALLGLLW
jgi:LuxR family transcriptional regulator, quorum-sensing system regulator SolR